MDAAGARALIDRAFAYSFHGDFLTAADRRVATLTASLRLMFSATDLEPVDALV